MSCRLFLFVISLSFPWFLFAQTGVWDNAKKLGDNTRTKAGKTAGTLKAWKQHLEEWGLDSSYNHALGIGARLNTDGWSGTIIYQRPLRNDIGRRRKKYPGQSRFYELSFSEVRHEKQIRQQKENNAYPQLGTPTPFVFGKINNLYLLQIGYGRQQLLLPGVLEGNISLSFRYSAGFSLAMLKPYYLRLIHVDYNPNQVIYLREEKYDDDNIDLFLNKDRILGASKWSRGLDEIRYVPGAFVDAAFVIEPSKNKVLIQTITLGGQLSAYTKELPVMAERKTYAYRGCLYVGLSIGKRWK